MSASGWIATHTIAQEAQVSSPNNLINNKKVQLSLTKQREAKPCQKVLQYDVETSYRQLNNLFEVMEIRCLVIKFLIQITSMYSS